MTSAAAVAAVVVVVVVVPAAGVVSLVCLAGPCNWAGAGGGRDWWRLAASREPGHWSPLATAPHTTETRDNGM